MTNINGHGPHRVVLYARASTDEQAHSIPGQVRELHQHVEAEGWHVVEVVADEGEKRHTLERPGVERLADLATSGAVDEVWAWAWDRYGESPVPEMLAHEMAAFGVALRSLDDGGDGEDAEDMRVIKSLFSRREQRTRVRRADRGRRDKSLRGEIFGGSPVRYGFRYVKGLNQRGSEVAIGYAVEEETMLHVRRIFDVVAAGGSIHEVQRVLEENGIPSPTGKRAWSRTTIRNIVQDDVYRPHSYEEMSSMIPQAVAARLDPGKVYGVSWSGRRRSRFARGKKREVYEAPREEWTAVPIDLTGSGLDRATVDLARERVADNRAPSKVGGREWELKGVLKCSECGRSMIAYRRAKKGGGFNFYYRCRPGSAQTPCPNRKSHPAETLERAVLHSVLHAVKDRDALERKANEDYERARARLTRVGGADLETWHRRLQDLDGRVARAQRAYLDGAMGVEDLRARTVEIEADREAVRRLLEEHAGRAETLAELDTKHRKTVELIRRGAWAELGITAPGARRERYAEIGLSATVDRHGEATTEWGVREDGIAYRPNMTTL